MLERSLIGDAYQDADLVFAREDGSVIHPDSFSDAFWRQAKEAKLPRIRFHDLRHTHATLALAAGVHPKVVSERLGHASITITLDTSTNKLTWDVQVSGLTSNIRFGHIHGPWIPDSDVSRVNRAAGIDPGGELRPEAAHEHRKAEGLKG